jgi:hypothetical protein
MCRHAMCVCADIFILDIENLSLVLGFFFNTIFLKNEYS